jgi:hypothetical protein
MPNYQNGKIYKLWSDQSDCFYIGSTTESLAKRLGQHKANIKKPISKTFELMKDQTNVRIELIEAFPCNNREELNAREGHYIRLHREQVLNMVIAGRTDKQYREDNRDKLSKQRALWCETNRDTLKAKKSAYYKANRDKISVQQAEYYSANKYEINARNAAYREANRDKIATYREVNRDKRNTQQTAYREANRDKCNAQAASYRIANRDKINARQRAKRAEKKKTTSSSSDVVPL